MSKKDFIHTPKTYISPPEKQAECPHLSEGLKPKTFGYNHIAFFFFSVSATKDPIYVSLSVFFSLCYVFNTSIQCLTTMMNKQARGWSSSSRERERESQKKISTSQVMYQLSISIDMKRWALSCPNHWQPTATDGCCENNHYLDRKSVV